jgi:hypothetical protein
MARVDVSALTIQMLANVALQCGDLARADVLKDDSRQRLHELAGSGKLVSRFQRGLQAHEVGDSVVLRESIADIERIAQTGRHRQARVYATELRAHLAWAEGRTDLAECLLEQAIELERCDGDQQGIVRSLTALGHVLLDQAQIAAALATFAEAVQRAWASGERMALIRALEGVARAMAPTDVDAAVLLVGATEGQRWALRAVYSPSERRYLETTGSLAPAIRSGQVRITAPGTLARARRWSRRSVSPRCS